MKTCAFVSRHAPTNEQILMAEKAGYCLRHIGDADGFTASVSGLQKAAGEDCETISCVHSGLAARVVASDLVLILWENGQRPDENGKPAFFAKALLILRHDGEFDRYTLD